MAVEYVDEGWGSDMNAWGTPQDLPAPVGAEETLEQKRVWAIQCAAILLSGKDSNNSYHVTRMARDLLNYRQTGQVSR